MLSKTSQVLNKKYLRRKSSLNWKFMCTFIGIKIHTYIAVYLQITNCSASIIIRPLLYKAHMCPFKYYWVQFSPTIHHDDIQLMVAAGELSYAFSIRNKLAMHFIYDKDFLTAYLVLRNYYWAKNVTAWSDLILIGFLITSCALFN